MVHESSSERITALLHDAIARLNRRLRQTRPLGELTQSQLSALASLDLAGALTPRELADAERVQPPTMTKIISQLEERGLIQRVPHHADRRQVILSPTESGREVLAADRRARDAWLGSRIGALSAEERDTLLRAAEIVDRISRA
jgi:DNA-binding MarR family transcriptional regulator